LNTACKLVRSNTVVPKILTKAVNQKISEYTEIKSAKIQKEPDLAQPNYEKNVSKATGHVDNRNLRIEEEESYPDEEQETSEKSDEFKKIEHPPSQEEESSIVVEFAEI
jgi:hypothetical protein